MENRDYIVTKENAIETWKVIKKRIYQEGKSLSVGTYLKFKKLIKKDSDCVHNIVLLQRCVNELISSKTTEENKKKQEEYENKTKIPVKFCIYENGKLIKEINDEIVIKDQHNNEKLANLIRDKYNIDIKVNNKTQKEFDPNYASRLNKVKFYL